MRAHRRGLVAEHDRGLTLIVAELEGEIAGAVVARPGMLENLFVLPSHWGSGVAGRLHDAALEISRGAGRATCRLEVLEENHRARRFYERRGWQRDDRRRPGEFPPHPVVVGYTIPLGPG